MTDSEQVLRLVRSADRVAAVRSTGLLDAVAEPAFDRLTRLAVRLLGVPTAFFTLVDESRDFYVAECGMTDALGGARELTGPTFCHYAIQSTEPLVIPDTAADPVYRAVPTVASHGVAAYIGVPIVVDEHAIGSFCVIDMHPRAWTPGEVETLTELAASASREIALRAAARSAERMAAELQVRVAQAQALAEELHVQTVKLERARADAEQANRFQGTFLGSMSHEFRTPLHAIGGFAQLLDLEVAGPLNSTQRDHLTRLRASNQHMLRLVDDMLDLAKLDAGELEVRADRAAVASVIAEAMSLTGPQAAARDVRLVDARDAAVPDYVGDEQRVRQILLNLLSNAIKFSPRGASIDVGTRILVCGASDDVATDLRRWIAVDVRDTGRGIPLEFQAAVFQPFTQLGLDSGAPRTGTGLGLAISRQLARNMGGDLTVASTPGVGSTFRLTLPVHDGA